MDDVEHERIVLELQGKIDLWRERYTGVRERYDDLVSRVPTIVSNAQAIVYIMRENMLRLEEKVSLMKDEMKGSRGG